MIKPGQIYREKIAPSWRKYPVETFLVTNVEYSISIIHIDGKTEFVGWEWIKGDCELIAEYPTWREAVNSKEFTE